MEQYNDVSRDAVEADYDATLLALTDDGSMPVEVQRADAVVRAQVNDVDAVPPGRADVRLPPDPGNLPRADGQRLEAGAVVLQRACPGGAAADDSRARADERI